MKIVIIFFTIMLFQTRMTFLDVFFCVTQKESTTDVKRHEG